MGLFPLDDELALVPGRFTPTQEEHLVHLAAWMPFAHAATLLQEIIGVQVSETTVRRHTEQAGEAYVQVQTEQWQLAAHPTDEQQAAAAKLALSSDGASVPLVQGQWAEVRTLAIGVVEQTDEHVHTSHLSSFSRMVDAATCADLAEVETRRRRVTEARAVCAVTDGATWLQELIDLHRPDAVRI